MTSLPIEPGINAEEVETADVYKAGTLAAHLFRSKTRTMFAYVPSYEGDPVASGLPIQEEPIITSPGAVPAFFAGLLPEGRRLLMLRQQLKTSVDDEFSLLLAVGRDPVGDVQVVREGESATESPDVVVFDGHSNDVDFSTLLAGDAPFDQVALAGVQDKVSARMIMAPASKGAKRYILKLNPEEYPFLIENEFYFLSLANRLGLPSANAEIVTDRTGARGLLVERFDRIISTDGSTLRLACEDACQVLGFWPADKYNVTCEQLTLSLSSMCAAQPVAVRDIFRQLCFAWLTGNGDVHAKNVSVLSTRSGEWRVAPAYDLPSTVPYGDDTFALTIDGKSHGFSRNRMLRFADSLGLPEKTASRIMAELLDGTKDVESDIMDGVIPFRPNVRKKMVGILRYRRNQW